MCGAAHACDMDMWRWRLIILCATCLCMHALSDACMQKHAASDACLDVCSPLQPWPSAVTHSHRSPCHSAKPPSILELWLISCTATAAVAAAGVINIDSIALRQCPPNRRKLPRVASGTTWANLDREVVLHLRANGAAPATASTKCHAEHDNNLARLHRCRTLALRAKLRSASFH